MTMVSKKLLLPLIALLITFSPLSHADKLLDKVVAVVNDEIVLKSELDQKTLETIQQLRAKQIPVNDIHQLQLKVLDNIILEMLQKDRAKKLGLSVTDEEVNEKLVQIATQNNMSLMELRNRLNMQMPNGFINLRNSIHEKLLIQKLREQEVIGRTMVTEEEIKNYLKRSSLDTSHYQYHLRHILITLPESATEAQRKEARAQINDLAKRINQGESFSQLAVRYSKGSKALSGGDLGWLNNDQIPTFFSEELSKLEPGQVSQVISSPSGFHLIKLVEKRDADDQLLTQYHLHRFIILSDNAMQQTEVPMDIQQIVADTQSLKAFNALKNRFADIPEEVNANSDMGWKTVDELPYELRARLAELSPNQVAAPIATEQGWILFFLEAERQYSAKKANQQQEAIQAIRMRKANETFEIWLRRLKDEAFIDIRI
ncbi:peptidylprolyl isomerase [Thiomicrorhabdus sp. ZW0627]|uniref:peptidylprolyl isomerase n=1 Tax=Thiomicrorhabdus sp. ZW0627 TaxID=3039774 RepID=UPI0024368407|nr:peptidylprolyl isomerase [Thiomicrorhabdus sp. ZW0627]MDG6773519.1 peptidylprolyl isomerase [Thiomicrorhabdus sp. ZW0627]